MLHQLSYEHGSAGIEPATSNTPSYGWFHAHYVYAITKPFRNDLSKSRLLCQGTHNLPTNQLLILTGIFPIRLGASIPSLTSSQTIHSSYSFSPPIAMLFSSYCSLRIHPLATPSVYLILLRLVKLFLQLFSLGFAHSWALFSH